MAISYGTSGSAYNSGSTSCTLPLSSATAGQLCAVIASFYSGGSITWPSGWNSQQGSPGGVTVTVGYKILTSADISSGLTLSSGSSGQIQMSFTSYSGTSPQEDNIGFASPFSSPSGSTSAVASNSTDWVIGLAVTSDGWTVGWSGTASLTQRVSGYTGTFQTEIADSTAAVAAGTYSQTATSGGSGTGSPTIYSVAVITISDASAPSAPTLTSPVNASYENLSSGLVFTATYNSTDGQNQNAYAFEIKTSGAGSYSYWNGTALQGSIVWLSDSVAPGGSFGATLPSSVISNGNTYNWSMASQEAGGNLQGSFATPFTFTGQGMPTVSVTAPTGAVATPEPTVTWTTTPGTGASQTAYRVVIYTAAQQSITGFTPGSSPSYWDSGTLAGANQSLPVGIALTNQATFYAYVQVTQTGGQTSAWVDTSFTVSFDPCSPPTITAAAGTDPVSGMPMVALTVQGTDNLLTYTDASFETDSTGTWAGGSNTNLSVSNAHSVDGSYSLLMTPTTSGSMQAGIGQGFYSTYYVPVTPNQAYTTQASFLAGVTGRSCTVEIQWFTSGGSVISDSTATATDSTSSWTTVLVNATAPSTAATARVLLSVASVSGSSDVHYVDLAGLQPGTSTAWARGGLVGTTNVAIQRSDGYYVRFASLASPAVFPATVSLVDSSASASTLTAVGTASVIASPTGPAFSQAARLNGNSYFTGPTGTAYADGAIAGAWTAEFLWTPYGPDVSGSLNPIGLGRAFGAVTNWEWFFQTGGTLSGGINFTYRDSSGSLHSIPLVTSATPGTTYALAASWDGTTMRGFTNGTVNATTFTNTPMTPVSQPMVVGVNRVSGGIVTGVIDEVRVSNVARYTSSYTVASAPFAADSNTYMLYHLDDVESNEVVTIYDYEAVPTLSYTYTATVLSLTNEIQSAPTTSSLVVLNTTQWWEFIPAPASGTGTATATSNSTAVQAQIIDWNPVQTEQSTAHPVAGQTTMNIVASTMMNQDFAGTFETFTVAAYQGLNVLMQGQQTVFISSPWGPIDSGYYRIGPSSGGLSTGVGNQTKNTKLMPSTSNAPHRTAQFTAVSQPRPPV